MCNSFNHHPSCTCGFGGEGHSGSSYGSSSHYGFRPLTNVTFESFIYPTSCPVCSDSVYFYRSPYDGRVFFDELGPFWTKHPCTDSSKTNVNRVQISSDYTPTKFFNDLRPHFRDGWDLFLIDSIYTQHDFIARAVGLPSAISQICRGRAIHIQKRRNVKVIKKNGEISNNNYDYEYTFNTLEIEIKEKAPFLQVGKLAYISQDLNEDISLNLSTYEIDKKTFAVKDKTIKVQLIKFR